jgi:hypothetical protein
VKVPPFEEVPFLDTHPLHRRALSSGSRCQVPGIRCPVNRGKEEVRKRLKIVGTNSTTPLESIKASKNELKTNWFCMQKRAIRGQVRTKQRERGEGRHLGQKRLVLYSNICFKQLFENWFGGNRPTAALVF